MVSPDLGILGIDAYGVPGSPISRISLSMDAYGVPGTLRLDALAHRCPRNSRNSPELPPRVVSGLSVPRCPMSLLFVMVQAIP